MAKIYDEVAQRWVDSEEQLTDTGLSSFSSDEGPRAGEPQPIRSLLSGVPLRGSVEQYLSGGAPPEQAAELQRLIDYIQAHEGEPAELGSELYNAQVQAARLAGSLNSAGYIPIEKKSGFFGFMDRIVPPVVMGLLAGAGGYVAGGAAGLTAAEAGAGAGAGEAAAGAGLGEGIGANAYFPAAAGGGGGGALTLGNLGTAASVAAPALSGGGADYSGAEFQGEVPPQSTGPGPTFDAFGNPIGGGGFFPAGSPGAGSVGTAAAGSALSRIIDGSGTTADWVQVLGTAGATGLGMFSANQQANALSDLQNQFRADRAPFLSAGTSYLDPQKWIEGPGQAFTQGTLQGLSATYGNPISSPTAMGIATDASMRNWLSGVNTLGSLGLGGQGIQANLGAGAIGARGDIYGNLAGGISDIISPRRSLADLLREFKLVI